LARLFDENHRLHNEINYFQEVIHHYRNEAQQLRDRNEHLELFVTRLKARLMAAEKVIAELQEALNKEPPPVAPRRQRR
jgi:regulator of replication initiation timing